jgi:hypothetical protein
MDKKTIVSLIVILIGITGLVWWTKVSDSKTLEGKSHPAIIGAPDNKLTAPENFYDFGTISMKNGLVTKLFKVVNSGEQDIQLPSLTTSCMCTKAYFIGLDGVKSGPFGMPGMGFVPKLDRVLKAGESADIEVVYDPNAHGPAGVGSIDRFVYLEDANGNKLQFEIKAQVTP